MLPFNLRLTRAVFTLHKIIIKRKNLFVFLFIHLFLEGGGAMERKSSLDIKKCSPGVIVSSLANSRDSITVSRKY